MIETAVISPNAKVSVLEYSRLTNRALSSSKKTLLDLNSNERAFLSSGGAKYGVIDYEGAGEMATVARMTMYAEDGAVLWLVSHHPANDLVPLESGGAVAMHRNINVLDNFIYFFDTQGSLLKEMKIPALGEVKASKAGSRILVNSGKRGTLLCDDRGNILAEMGSAYRTALSNDGLWVALLYGSEFRVFREGALILNGELNGEIIRGASFAADSRILAAFTDHSFYLLSIPEGRILSSQQLDVGGQLSFTSVEMSPDGGLTATGVERDLGPGVVGPQRHPDGEIRLYDRSGNLLYRKQITYSHWNTTTPRVHFSADGKTLVVLTRDEVIKAPVSNLTTKGGAR
jgi:hypothetical protein